MSQDITASQTTTILTILAEIGEALSANLPLEIILTRVVSALTRLMPSCDAVGIAIPDARLETVTIRAAADGMGSPRVQRIGWTAPIKELRTVQALLRTRTSLYLPDTSQSSVWRSDLHPDIRALAWFGLPLIMHESIVGFLFIDFFTTHPLDDERRYAVEAFARYAATAIDSARQRDSLRHSEERYRLAANLASNAIYEWTPGSGMVEWSGDIDGLLGYPPGGFPCTEAEWMDAIHPDDRQHVKALRERAMREDTPFEAEYRLRRADGEYGYVTDRGVRLTDSSHILGALSDLTDIYRLTDALISSEAHYRTIFARSRHAIFVIDKDGRIVDVNPAAEILTKRDYAELIAGSILDLAAPGESEPYHEMLHQLRDQGEFGVREMRMSRQDSGLAYIQVWATGLGDDLYEVAAHDVSEQRRAHALAARRTAELLALGDLTRTTAAGGTLADMLHRALPDALGVLEIGQGCIYLRDGQRETFRLAAQVGFEPNQTPPHELPLSAAGRGQATDFSELVRVIEQPGEPYTSLQAPLMSSGVVIGLVIFSEKLRRSVQFNDINLMDTVARQLEIGVQNVRLLSDLEGLVQERTAALAASEARYKSLIEQVPGTVYTADTVYDGLRFISGDTGDLFGQPPQEILQTRATLLAFVSPEDMSWVREQANTAMALGKDFDAQYRVVNPHSEAERWVHHRARPIRTEMRDVFWLGLLTDETRLKELDKLKNQFVSAVSHELRTPLSVIKLRASTLRNYYDRLSETERRAMVERINYQTDVLTQLIEDVLRLSQLDSDKSEHQIEPIDVIAVGTDVVEELRSTAELAGLTMRAAWPADRCFVHADASDIARIWRNLIDNAIKYTAAPGWINIYAGCMCVDQAGGVRARSADGPLPHECVTVPPDLAPREWTVGVVQDTGRGISDRDQELIFTRFFRGEAAMTNIPGTGLGLSLVKELVEGYGGRVVMHSRVGEGSTFAFWLPTLNTEEA